jgi:glycosyltransferase involved in cell wall biosynthesis
MKSLSIIIPCLNEEESLSFCLKKIHKILKKENLIKKTETIVVDNGSTDNSVKIAKNLGAKVAFSEKGYGNALRKGIKIAKGEFVAFADADDSYNFLELPKFIEKARQGFQLVQGNRFEKYGGKIHNGAMPFSHRYFGNPLISFLVKFFFNIKFNDVFCGFRLFKKEIYNKNFYFSTGMEFAIENLIKLSHASIKSVEIPITLHKDKRVHSSSHLKTFSDGFKALKFILVHGIQVPSLIVSIFFLILSINKGLLDIINTEIFNENFFYSCIFFFISLQFILFFFFSNLASQKLGFQKEGIVNIVYKYISFNKSVLVVLLLIFMTLSIIILNKLNFLQILILNQLTIVFIFGLSILCFVNILMISILEYFENTKNN